MKRNSYGESRNTAFVQRNTKEDENARWDLDHERVSNQYFLSF